MLSSTLTEGLRNDDRRQGPRFESLDFNANERKLNAYYAEFQPTAAEDAPVHAHCGVEPLSLITGRLLLTVGREQHELAKGGD